MCREADARQLLFVAPVVVVAVEGAVAVLIDGSGDAVSAQDHVQELEIADGILVGPELHPQCGPRCIVGGMDERTGRPLRPEPAVGATIPLH